MDAFVTERKHSLAKQAADPAQNTSVYEKSVLSRSISLHVGTLSSLRRDGLLGGQMPPEWPGVTISKKMHWRGTIVAEGDVLLKDSSWVYVRGCLLAPEGLALLAQTLQRGTQVNTSRAPH